MSESLKTMKRQMLIGLLLPVVAMAAPVNKYQLKGDEKTVDLAPAATNETQIAPGKMLSADGKTVWWDGSLVPMEGKGFKDTKRFYDRMPARLEHDKSVRRGVWSQCYHSSGECFRFRLKGAQNFKVRWSLIGAGLAMGHMPATGVSGLDIYLRDKETGEWKFFQNARPKQQFGNEATFWTYGMDAMVYLPLYNGPSKIEFGVPKGATFEPLPERESGITKPVVFYGTSITHGGCCSRPGLAFVNWIGRDLDVPVVGLGFSGSGVMEFEMSEHLARIDASCYVLDCLWNMSLKESQRPGRSVERNYEPFIRNLRAKRPGVPIVMAEHCNVYGNEKDNKDRFIRGLYEKLIAEGWTDLVYLPNDAMYTGDYEGTVDGCHPNDLGMMSMSKAFGKAVKEALKLK